MVRFIILSKWLYCIYILATLEQEVAWILVHYFGASTVPSSIDGSLVIINNCVEPVSNCDDCALSKLCTNGLLDEFICLQVYCGCGFIQHQDLGLTQEGSCKADKLTLSYTQIFSPLGYGVLQAFLQRGDKVAEVSTLESSPYILILVALKWIKIDSQSTRKENWILSKELFMWTTWTYSGTSRTMPFAYTLYNNLQKGTKSLQKGWEAGYQVWYYYLEVPL